MQKIRQNISAIYFLYLFRWYFNPSNTWDNESGTLKDVFVYCLQYTHEILTFNGDHITISEGDNLEFVYVVGSSDVRWERRSRWFDADRAAPGNSGDPGRGPRAINVWR